MAVTWLAGIVTATVRPWATVKFDDAQPDALLVIVMLLAEISAWDGDRRGVGVSEGHVQRQAGAGVER